MNLQMMNNLPLLCAMNAPGILAKAAIENESRFRIVNNADADYATVYVYDVIGGWWGIDPLEFGMQLEAIDKDLIHLRVNSPGGDVFAARTMRTAIKQHKAKVVAHIDGLAASAATYLTTGADEIEITDGAFYMIHNAWTFTGGNAQDHEESAGLLRQIDGTINKDYRRKTNSDVTEEMITAWMDAETWFSSDDALKHGFVDRIYDADDEDDQPSNRTTWNLSAYANAPTKDADKPTKTTVNISLDGRELAENIVANLKAEIDAGGIIIQPDSPQAKTFTPEYVAARKRQATALLLEI